ncbi:MAG: hypothetical protein OQK75_02750 [Gammaproteobacteria bacterium]|nr:hypothetical protein [Gammaproteobacteria bacterium]MCW8986567.1 hypothetical protein [Gammaproteobacteria bacterium]MCW9031976.1 hypothetical protein [Gammaproteobacteria bacterium]
MKVDNALSLKYLLEFPAEAARVLEQAAAEDVAALFSEFPVQTIVPVLATMLSEKAASCVELMDDMFSAKLLSAMSVSSAARIYHLLSESKQKSLESFISDKTQKQIHQYLKYPALSAGALLQNKVDMLPVNITVADANRRIGHLEHAVSCEIYIVNDAHQLQGMVELGRLLKSSHHLLLRDIMIRKTQPVSAHAMAESLLSHPGWITRRRLPVIERDNTLLGVLEYKRLQKIFIDINKTSTNDPVENIFSLTHLYWTTLAQLLNSLFTVTSSGNATKTGEKK